MVVIPFAVIIVIHVLKNNMARGMCMLASRTFYSYMREHSKSQSEDVNILGLT